MLPDVQADLRLADLILFKLDAVNPDIFEAINGPCESTLPQQIIEGIESFKLTYEGKLALQMMFTEANKGEAQALADAAREIGPDEIQLNTPLRPSPERPLTPQEMEDIESFFAGLPVRSVYKEKQDEYQPFDDEATEKRHGKFQDQGR